LSYSRLHEDKEMTEEKEQKGEEKEEKKQGKPGEPLPFCTTAPSAEHARGNVEEEPCDDARKGE
jgi:hypothetical protein